MTKPTKWPVRQAKQRLGSAWASTQSDQSSLCTERVAKGSRFLHADSKDSDQTGRMPRIWVFAGCTCHFVGFVMRLLIWKCGQNGKQCRTWPKQSDHCFCSGYTLFAQTCLSEYLRSFWLDRKMIIMSLVTRKAVFGTFNQVRLKLASEAS